MNRIFSRRWHQGDRLDVIFPFNGAREFGRLLGLLWIGIMIAFFVSMTGRQWLYCGGCFLAYMILVAIDKYSVLVSRDQDYPI